jgi:hypothetical protein
MTNGYKRIAIIGLAALAAAGCTNSVSVRPGRRSHPLPLGNNPARGEIAIEPLDPAMRGASNSAAMPPRWSGNWRRLAGGWCRAGASEQVALVRVEQSTREAARRGSGLSIGIGGGSYGRNVGVGGGLTLPIGGARPGRSW